MTTGFSLAFWVGAGFTLAGAVAALTLLPTRRALVAVPAAEAECEPEPLAA